MWHVHCSYYDFEWYLVHSFYLFSFSFLPWMPKRYWNGISIEDFQRNLIECVDILLLWKNYLTWLVGFIINFENDIRSVYEWQMSEKEKKKSIKTCIVGELLRISFKRWFRISFLSFVQFYAHFQRHNFRLWWNNSVSLSDNN